jgi:hypothetical protein
MGPSIDHPFPYPPPRNHNLALVQVPFATPNLESQGSRLLFLQMSIHEMQYKYGSLLTITCYI